LTGIYVASRAEMNTREAPQDLIGVSG